MFIETVDTPNPHAMKFLPGQVILPAGEIGVDFPNRETAKNSPLTTALFDIDDVVGVFLGNDFITVTKTPDATWPAIRPVIMGTIVDFLSAGIPVLDHMADSSAAGTSGQDMLEPYDDATKKIVTQIIDLLETRVRPAVAGDGGDIVFHKFVPEDGVVYLSMRGACAGCPSSTMTLKSGIENLLCHYVPEVRSVEAVM